MTVTRPIREVIEETGIPRELIHHYLREGLVPPSVRRGRYDERQVRLLTYARLLREEHGLSIPAIRALFERLSYDPDRIAILTLTESPGRRMRRFGEEECLLSDGDGSGAPVWDEAHLARCIEAGIATVSEENSQRHLSVYDRSAAALVQAGMAQGISFESFRTIAAQVRLAFDLEHEEFFHPRNDEDLFAALFVKREIVTAFVQSCLLALAEHHVMRSAGDRPRAVSALSDLVYRPSSAFEALHGIDKAIERSRLALGKSRREAAWVRFVDLLLHAGRYDEAIFSAREGCLRFKKGKALPLLLSRARLLAGERIEVEDPLLSLLEGADRLLRQGSPEGTLKAAAAIPSVVEQALSRVTGKRDRLEAKLFGGYLLAAIPSPLRQEKKGMALLREALALAEAMPSQGSLPGLRDRYKLNAAWLLIAVSDRTSPREDREAWRDIVCRLDPASEMARLAFQAIGRPR